MFRSALAGVLAGVVSPLALGHGVQIQITHNAGSGLIETREIVHTDSRPDMITDLKRVYVMPLMPQVGGAGDGWYSRPDDARDVFGNPIHPTGPGVSFQYDSQLSGAGWAFSGSSTLPNLQSTNFGLSFSRSLGLWDGAAFIDPGQEQLQAFRGDGTAVPTLTATTSDVGPFSSLALSTIATQSSNPHSSVGYRLLGDGVSPGLSGLLAGDNGVYLVGIQITSSASGVGASEPIYFVLHKNTDLATALTAAESLGFDASLTQVVPEPHALGLFSLAALMALRRR